MSGLQSAYAPYASLIEQSQAANANLAQYPGLLASVLYTESQFNPSAVSPTNSNGSRDYGIAQLNSYYHNPAQALNPSQAIPTAAALLNGLIGEYGVTGALEAYNSGKPSGDPTYAQKVAASQALLAQNLSGVTTPTYATAGAASSAASGASASQALASVASGSGWWGWAALGLGAGAVLIAFSKFA